MLARVLSVQTALVLDETTVSRLLRAGCLSHQEMHRRIYGHSLDGADKHQSYCCASEQPFVIVLCPMQWALKVLYSKVRIEVYLFLVCSVDLFTVSKSEMRIAIPHDTVIIKWSDPCPSLICVE